VKAEPGAHSEKYSLPLAVVLRDMLGYAKTSKEAKRIANLREVLVNGRPETSIKAPIGLFDVIEFPKTKSAFVVKLSRNGKLMFEPTKAKDSRLCRLENKTIVSGGKLQLNLWGGLNVLAGKDDYKVGDTLKIGLKDNKVLGKVEFKEGSNAHIIGGTHVGETANIQKIEQIGNRKEVLLKGEKGEFRTRKEYIYPVE
jgi:small subunit ribosomal protein S4e